MKKFASVSLRATSANLRKTSKNVSLPLLILTAKFVPESAVEHFQRKVCEVGSPGNTSSSTQLRRDPGEETLYKNTHSCRMFLVTLAVLLRQRFFSFSAAFNCALIKRAFTWPSRNKDVVLKQSKLKCKQLSFRYKRPAEFISKPHCDCQK